MKSLISVVIPVYNVAKYLSACLDSVINQTYQNLEIIIVDDGSTDISPSICDEYAKKDERITVIHKKNGGLSDARNAGIDIAKGEYITFIDSDDLVAIDMVDYLYKCLIENNTDMSTCLSADIDEDGRYISSNEPERSAIIDGGSENCMKAFLTNAKFKTVAWGKLYRFSMFSDVRYPKGKYHEDVFTTYKLVAKCKSITIGGEFKYFYRNRSESMMTLSFKPSHMDAIEGKQELNTYIEHNYPSLSRFSHANIVYAANLCSMRIARGGILYKNFIEELQEIYRKYEHDFLRGISSAKSKAFSVLAFINLRFLLWLLKKRN